MNLIIIAIMITLIIFNYFLALKIISSGWLTIWPNLFSWKYLYIFFLCFLLLLYPFIESFFVWIPLQWHLQGVRLSRNELILNYLLLIFTKRKYLHILILWLPYHALILVFISFFLDLVHYWVMLCVQLSTANDSFILLPRQSWRSHHARSVT